MDLGADEYYRHLYYTGTPVPGQGIDLKLIGMPGQPACLYVGMEPLARPKNTPCGLWYLESPFAAYPLGCVTGHGLVKKTLRVPPDFPAPSTLFLQALVRELTAPCALEIAEPAW
jgi:hypothetical protein